MSSDINYDELCEHSEHGCGAWVNGIGIGALKQIGEDINGWKITADYILKNAPKTRLYRETLESKDPKLNKWVEGTIILPEIKPIYTNVYESGITSRFEVSSSMIQKLKGIDDTWLDDFRTENEKYARKLGYFYYYGIRGIEDTDYKIKFEESEKDRKSRMTNQQLYNEARDLERGNTQVLPTKRRPKEYKMKIVPSNGIKATKKIFGDSIIPIPDSIYGTLFIDKEEYDNRLALRKKLKSFISEKTQRQVGKPDGRTIPYKSPEIEITFAESDLEQINLFLNFKDPRDFFRKTPYEPSFEKKPQVPHVLKYWFHGKNGLIVPYNGGIAPFLKIS